MLDGLHSRTGPEVPPDVVVPPAADKSTQKPWFAATTSRPATAQPAPRPATGKPGWKPPGIDEPTQKLLILPSPPPPRFAARAVIVYEQVQRRPWRLLVFTAVLVALTIGVVLGQAEAFQPASRGPSAQAAAVLSTPAPAAPPAVYRVTAPLGAAKTRVFEVSGAAAILRVTSADLGDDLYNVTALDGSATPRLTDTGGATRLDLVPTGTPGTVGAEVRLNAKVAWTVRVAGGSADREIDMRSGGLAALELSGTTARATLRLSQPRGSVRVRLTGPVTELTVLTVKTAPVRLRLGAGAGLAVVDGTTHRKVKARATFSERGWTAARNRYDVVTSAAVGTASVLRP